MKYCPYCGADLIDGAASFCAECGKSMPDPADSGIERKEPRVLKAKETNTRPHDRKKSRKHKKKATSPVPKEEARKPKDDGYDGYYDDVLPSDTGKLKEGVDKELIKKIAAVAGVMLLIIGLCVVAMYML